MLLASKGQRPEMLPHILQYIGQTTPPPTPTKNYSNQNVSSEKVLEIDLGDGCTTMRVYLMPINSTPKNS